MYHICFCANEKYMKFAAAMMNNILANTKISNQTLAGGGILFSYSL